MPLQWCPRQLSVMQLGWCRRGNKPAEEETLPSRLLELPAEIRMLIYEHIVILPRSFHYQQRAEELATLAQDRRSQCRQRYAQKASRLSIPNLLLTCRQVHDEASHVMYEKSTFSLAFGSENCWRSRHGSPTWLRDVEWVYAIPTRWPLARITSLKVELAYSTEIEDAAHWAQHGPHRYEMEGLQRMTSLETLLVRIKNSGYLQVYDGMQNPFPARLAYLPQRLFDMAPPSAVVKWEFIDDRPEWEKEMKGPELQDWVQGKFAEFFRKITMKEIQGAEVGDVEPIHHRPCKPKTQPLRWWESWHGKQFN